jgi:hypothetical protein
MKAAIVFGLWVVVLASAALAAGGEPTNPAWVELNKASWLFGRDYFVLRSGRAQLVVQADQVDLGPAVTYLMFDAQNARQSARKDGALNWVGNEGVGASALEVVLGGFRFTALGHRTETGWETFHERTPCVKAMWWAGGIRVTERLVALPDAGAFYRLIELEGAHLVQPESVTLRLHLPGTDRAAAEGWLVTTVPGAQLAVGAIGDTAARVQPEDGQLLLGPLTVEPGGWVRVPTLLAVQVPGTDRATFLSGIRRVAGEVADGGLADADTFWQRTSRIHTADGTVQGTFDRARFALAGMIADDGTMDAGIFEYGAQWVRDTSNTALGALHAGHFEIVRAALVRMLTQMVSRDGATMIANSFEKPELEQFDQMGELMHLLKAYRDWTGDDSLIREHRDLLRAMIERPLHPTFRDGTGMVHNRREFWERAFLDAYELAYQTYVILGWRDAADLAPALGATDRASRWRAEADRTLEAVLRHPTRALVRDGRLIKRRNVTGEVADDPAGFRGFAADVPLNTETGHRLMPDASMALPLALGIIDARTPVGLGTLDHLEGLWNARWSDGGYDRYHTSGQPDQPGPWPFATTFILRAQHEAGRWESSRRSLEWLDAHAGGRTGVWFEEVPSVRSVSRTAGLVCWTSGEITLFTVRHYLGVRFEGDRLTLKPALYPGSPPVHADLRFRSGRLTLDVSGSGRVVEARCEGMKLRVDPDGVVRLPSGFAGGHVVLRTRPAAR